MRYLNSPLIGTASGARALATPALVIDFPAFERNLRAMQAHCDRVGLKLRPHAKTHKSTEVARRQIRPVPSGNAARSWVRRKRWPRAALTVCW